MCIVMFIPTEGVDGVEADVVLKRLSELVQVVQTCLGQHSGMQSTEIKNTAMILMQTYQGAYITLIESMLYSFHRINALLFS